MNEEQIAQLVNDYGVEAQIIMAIVTVISQSRIDCDEEKLYLITEEAVSKVSDYRRIIKMRREYSLAYPGIVMSKDYLEEAYNENRIEDMRQKLYHRYGIELDSQTRDLLLEKEFYLPTLGQIIENAINMHLTCYYDQEKSDDDELSTASKIKRLNNQTYL